MAHEPIVCRPNFGLSHVPTSIRARQQASDSALLESAALAHHQDAELPTEKVRKYLLHDPQSKTASSLGNAFELQQVSGSFSAICGLARGGISPPFLRRG